MSRLQLLFFVAIILGAILLLSSCAPCEATPQVPDEMPLDSVVYKAGGTYVKEFHLPDGTRCVTLFNEAITCEWKHGT